MTRLLAWLANTYARVRIGSFGISGPPGEQDEKAKFEMKCLEHEQVKMHFQKTSMRLSNTNKHIDLVVYPHDSQSGIFKAFVCKSSPVKHRKFVFPNISKKGILLSS